MKKSIIKHAVLGATALSLMACGKDAQVAQAKPSSAAPMVADAKASEKLAPAASTPVMALVKVLVDHPTDNWGQAQVEGVRWQANKPFKAPAGNYALNGSLMQKSKSQEKSLIALTGTATAFDEILVTAPNKNEEVSAASVQSLLGLAALKQIGKNCQAPSAQEAAPVFYEGEMAGQKVYVQAVVDTFTNAHVHEASLDLSLSLRVKPFDQEMVLAQCAS